MFENVIRVLMVSKLSTKHTATTKACNLVNIIANNCFLCIISMICFHV